MDKQGVTLSLQAIVAIIFAVTILGLGLFFINETFNSVTERFILPEPTIQATPTQPLILPQTTFEVSSPVDVVISFAFYNTEPTTTLTPLLSECAPTHAFTLTGLPQEVAQGEQALFSVVLAIPQDTVANTFVCSLKVGNVEQQFVVKVT